MASLFENVTIGNRRLRNRILRSATWEGLCDSGGAPTPSLASFYARLAVGGVGGLVTGFAFVT